jgi:NDP-sugar pyrophosphorylase family protein
MKVVILGGGLGPSLMEETESRPKPIVVYDETIFKLWF